MKQVNTATETTETWKRFRFCGRGAASVVLTFAAVGLLAGCAAPVEFSPDGKRIVFFWADPARHTGLFTARTDGSDLRALPNSGDAMLARWSPDGAHILFLHHNDRLGLYDTRTHHTRVLNVAAAPPLVWRGDSREFAAAVAVPGKTAPRQSPRTELRRFDALSGRPLQRTPLPVAQIAPLNAQMAWLPGSEDLIFMGAKNDDYALYRTRGQRVETIVAGHVLGFGLDAARTRLLWAQDDTTARRLSLTIHHLDLATGRPEASVRLALAPPPAASLPADWRNAPRALDLAVFSPDGTRLAFLVEGRENARLNTTLVYTRVGVTRLDEQNAGRPPYYLAPAPDVRALAQRPSAGPTVFMVPSWSPDSRTLAIYESAQSTVRLRLFDFNPNAGDIYQERRVPLPDSLTPAVTDLHFLQEKTRVWRNRPVQFTSK